ncbi:MAG TPA: hypothetical protein VK822_06060, partial [Acetobacteraceae bacterium]|nr:hypothetical protein [Acetobacteraceae bacterium]
MTKIGPRDDTKVAAIKLEWWPRSDWNKWPPSLESTIQQSPAAKPGAILSHKTSLVLDQPPGTVNAETAGRLIESHPYPTSQLRPRESLE